MVWFGDWKLFVDVDWSCVEFYDFFVGNFEYDNVVVEYFEIMMWFVDLLFGWYFDVFEGS